MRRRTTAASRSNADPAPRPASASTGLQRRRQPLGRQRRGPVLVDDAARGGLERGRQRADRLRDVVVDRRVELGRLVALPGTCVIRKKQLRLPLVEIAHEPARGARRRAAAGGPRWPAGCSRALASQAQSLGQLDLDEPLGAAADRADLLAERRTAASGAAGAAEGTAPRAAVYTRSCGKISRARRRHGLGNSATPNVSLRGQRDRCRTVEPSEAVGRLRDHHI